jgi:hypothetical protein
MTAIDINNLNLERIKELYTTGWAYMGKEGKPTERGDQWIKDMVSGILFKDENVTWEDLEKFIFFYADRIAQTGRTAKAYGYGALARIHLDEHTLPTEDEIKAKLNPTGYQPKAPAVDEGAPSMPQKIENNTFKNEFEGMSPVEVALLMTKQIAKDRRELLAEKIRLENEQREKQIKKDQEAFEKKLKQIQGKQGTADVLKGDYHCNGWKRISAHTQASLLMLNGEIVALWGPKGTGKTEYWINLCKDLGWRAPYITTAPMFKTDLTGFTDALGKYQRTQFTEGYQSDADHPCIVLIEEIDRATPEALIALNSALANGVMDTPIGNIHQGEGCHIVFTANTNGNGGSLEYNTANQLDASTIDRAKWLFCGYDPSVMKSICGDNDELYAFAQDVLNALKQVSHIRGVSMTYRTLRDIRNTELLMTINKVPQATVKAIDCSMTKGANASEIRAVYDALSDKDNKYAKAFEQVPKIMKSSGEY